MARLSRPALRSALVGLRSPIAIAPHAIAIGGYTGQRKLINNRTFKATVAYILAYVFVFTNWSKLETYPITLTYTILVVIAGLPGKSIGATFDAVVLALLGLGLGSVGFVILAHLGKALVAQGIVLAIIVYLFALVKAQGPRFIGFALIGIVVSFQGAYTSLANFNGAFSAVFLEDLLKAFLWGAAIVLFANIVILPYSAERELRMLLVASLQHAGTLAHLISKSYTLDLTDEERGVRDQLIATVRADFVGLVVKLRETGMEINYSRHSLAEYREAVAHVQDMQKSLITAYSSLIDLERATQDDMRLFRSRFLPGSLRAFQKLRRLVDLCIDDTVAELHVGQLLQLPSFGHNDYQDDDYDAETGTPMRSTSHLRRSGSKSSVEPFQLVSDNLRSEVDDDSLTPAPTRPASTANMPASSDQGSEKPFALDDGVYIRSAARDLDSCQKNTVENRPDMLRELFQRFADAQVATAADVIASGELATSDDLHVLRPEPSMHEKYGRIARETMTNAPHQPPSPQSDDEKLKIPEAPASEKPGPARLPEHGADYGAGSAQLARIFTFVFAMDGFVQQIQAMHKLFVPHHGTPKRKKSIHFHALEQARSPKGKHDGIMSVDEVFGLLDNKPCPPRKVTFPQYLDRAEKLLRTETSLGALKTSCAVMVLAAVLLAPSSRDFWISYGLTGSLIAIIVAMAPTLGQSLLTFVLQICGTGIGATLGLIVLEAFKNVGGREYNEYGITALMGLFCIPPLYVLYSRPAFFAFGLLSLNGAGSIIVTMYNSRGVPNFDSVALRYGKALTAMVIAIAIAGFFQVFIRRAPARQQLRISMANTFAELSAYHSVLQKYIAIVTFAPQEGSEGGKGLSPETLQRVQMDLANRERAIQGSLIAFMPLIKFASVEPSLGHPPFRPDLYLRLLRSVQITLDRLREARAIRGDGPLDPRITEHFAKYMIPYRIQTERYTRASLYMATSSLLTKRPLPIDLPSVARLSRMSHDDAIVLATRLAKSPEGHEFIRSRKFSEYMAYLMSVTSVGPQLEQIEKTLAQLFPWANGEIEAAWRT